MAWFLDTTVTFLDAYSNDTIDEEEFVLQYDAQKSKNPDFIYIVCYIKKQQKSFRTIICDQNLDQPLISSLFEK